MSILLYRSLTLLVACCLVATGLPRPSQADPSDLRGKSTASEAAGVPALATGPRSAVASPVPGVMPARALSDAGVDALRFGAMSYALAQTDTTEGGFEFPEEEKSHVWRDVAIFVIVSAFVAYFVIKVFLEGDTDEGSGDDGGKDVPNPN
jgi:hypothetical protein